MTTTVVVTAHCAKDRQVMIIEQAEAGEDGRVTYLQDTESFSAVVYDNRRIRVHEIEKRD